jgi:hypothetical protein
MCADNAFSQQVLQAIEFGSSFKAGCRIDRITDDGQVDAGFGCAKIAEDCRA